MLKKKPAEFAFVIEKSSEGHWRYLITNRGGFVIVCHDKFHDEAAAKADALRTRDAIANAVIVTE